MKLFIHRKMFDHKGDVIIIDGSENAQASSLGQICVTALLTDTQADQNADFAAKMHKWNLSRQIQKCLEEDKDDDAFVEMPTEDIALIKKRIGMVFTTRIVGPAANALEASSPKAVKPMNQECVDVTDYR